MPTNDTTPACPDCGSDATVGFDTGDRVCRQCNHNWDPDAADSGDTTDDGTATPSATTAGNLAGALRSEPFMSAVNTYEETAYGTVKVSCGGEADLTESEAEGIQNSDRWRIVRVDGRHAEVGEAD